MTFFPQPRGVCLLFGLVGDLGAEFAESWFGKLGSSATIVTSV